MVAGEPVQSPSPGKALVRLHNPYGKLENLGEFWDGAQYVGVSKGGTVIYHQCEPGRRLFYLAKGYAVTAVDAELAPGRVYDLVVECAWAFIIGPRRSLELRAVERGSPWREKIERFLKKEKAIRLELSRFRGDFNKWAARRRILVERWERRRRERPLAAEPIGKLRPEDGLLPGEVAPQSGQ